MQFSISSVNSTEICTLFSVQTVAALRNYRAVSMYLNSGYHSACLPVNILSYLPRTPDIGNISDCYWHSIMGLSPQHGSHAAVLTASNSWPDGSIIIPLRRSSRTECHIGFGSCSLSLGYKSTFGILWVIARSAKCRACPILWFRERHGVALLSLSTTMGCAGESIWNIAIQFSMSNRG